MNSGVNVRLARISARLLARSARVDKMQICYCVPERNITNREHKQLAASASLNLLSFFVKRRPVNKKRTRFRCWILDAGAEVEQTNDQVSS